MTIYTTKYFKQITILFLFISILMPVNALVPKNSKFTNFEQDRLLDIFNHNDTSTDERINLVFNTGVDSIKNAPMLYFRLPDLIGWNGPVIQKTTNNEVYISRGMFATNQIRNSKNKFNIWFFAENKKMVRQLPEYNLLKNTVNIVVRQDSLSLQGNSDLGLNLKFNESAGANASWNAKYYREYYKLNNIITHELGHAIFGLGDEYNTRSGFVEDDTRGRTLNQVIDTYNPNCTVNNEYGKSVWKQYLGQVDPMYYEIKDLNSKLGLNMPLKESDYKVDYVNQPRCKNSIESLEIKELGFIKPTVNSIMNDTTEQIQIWGSVNTAQIEKVLSKFKGTGPNIDYVKPSFTKDDVDKVKNQSLEDYFDKPLVEAGVAFDPNAYRQGTSIELDPYLQVRRDILHKLNLQDTFLLESDNPRLPYGSFTNSFILYIIDGIIYTIIILVITLTIYKRRKNKTPIKSD